MLAGCLQRLWFEQRRLSPALWPLLPLAGVFSLAAAAFVTPYVIGGSRVKVIPLQIYNAAVTTFEWPLAATLSVLLFVLCIVLTALVARMSERRFAGWLRGA